MYLLVMLLKRRYPSPSWDGPWCAEQVRLALEQEFPDGP